MCQNSTDSQAPLSGACAKVHGHATAQLQLSNQSPVMCQPGISVIRTPFCGPHAPVLTPTAGRSSRWLLLTLRPRFKGEFPCVIFLRLHALGAGNELIARFAPSRVEPHFLMSFAAFFVSMHGERRIFR